MALYNYIQQFISVDDVVSFTSGNLKRIGRVRAIVSRTDIEVVLFIEVSNEMLLQHSLVKITHEEAPLASKSGMVEVMQSVCTAVIPRSAIVDLCFIVPLEEVESGSFHLTGAEFVFYIRFDLQPDGSKKKHTESFIHPRMVDPLTYRIFRSLNLLSLSIKKMFYHRPENESIRKTVQLMIPFECFYYISWKISTNNNIVAYSFDRKQRIIVYHDDLSMRNRVKVNRIHIARFLNKAALAALQDLLGVGVGIGLGKPRPTKAKPLVYCCINDTITFLDLPNELPVDYIMNPHHRLDVNGIDFVYTVDNQLLKVNVHYKKKTVNMEQDVASIIRTADIRNEPIVPYIGAFFFMENIMTYAV
jgi:hypothetical protein